MDLRLVLVDLQPELAGRQAADRGEKAVRSDHAVALRRDELDAGRQQFLLGVEDVEGRARPTLASSRTPFSAVSAA